jgi:hypothetical protein
MSLRHKVENRISKKIFCLQPLVHDRFRRTQNLLRIEILQKKYRIFFLFFLQKFLQLNASIKAKTFLKKSLSNIAYIVEGDSMSQVQKKTECLRLAKPTCVREFLNPARRGIKNSKFSYRS